jgi:hypothetical protein
MVQEGFSWRVLFFGWLGLLTYGTWISAMMAAAVSILLHLLVSARWEMALIISLHAALATFTSDIRLWEMRLNGRQIGAPITAPSKDIALLRWADRQPSPVSPPEFPCASS